MGKREDSERFDQSMIKIKVIFFLLYHGLPNSRDIEAMYENKIDPQL